MEREILQFLGTSGIYFGLPKITVASISAYFDRRGQEITPAISLRRRRADKAHHRSDDASSPAGRGRVLQPRWASSRQIAALFS